VFYFSFDQQKSIFNPKVDEMYYFTKKVLKSFKMRISSKTGSVMVKVKRQIQQTTGQSLPLSRTAALFLIV
jgi:hypothetical protein